MFNLNKNNSIKILIFFLELIAGGLFIYLIVLPFYPTVKYKVSYENSELAEGARDPKAVKKIVAEYKNSLPAGEYAVSPNRVIIPKIGVNAPIIESESSEYGLSKGSWLVPNTSTPDKGGNTVITGHRFKYLPPNNLTFYLFDKLEVGDLVSIIWHKENYLYKIKETKIVPKTEISIMNQTKEATLTMFTCHPIYSTEKRLVIIAELIND